MSKWCPSGTSIGSWMESDSHSIPSPLLTSCDLERIFVQFMDHHAICLQSHERLYRPCRKDAFFPQLGTQVLWPHWPRWGRLEVWICWVKSQAQMMPGMARFGQQLLFKVGSDVSWKTFSHVNFTYFFTPISASCSVCSCLVRIIPHYIHVITYCWSYPSL